MAYESTESYRKLEGLIAGTGHTCAFDDATSVACLRAVMAVMADMRLNPMETDQLRRGLTELFHIEVVNMPDLDHTRYILAPNHVSDFDALLLGLLHPSIKIVSKKAWTDNEKLTPFLSLHYDIYGFDRSSLADLRRLLSDAIRYFNDSDEVRHYLVFSQGTISDFNKNRPERVSTVALQVSNRTGVPIVPMFIEQASLEYPTRIVFDEPMVLDPGDDFRKKWIEREIVMQNALVPPGRRPVLTEKHSNNNGPGERFF